MPGDPNLDALNDKLAGLVRELDAKTVSFVNAFAEFLKDWYPTAAERAIRHAPERAIDAAQRGRLSALKEDIRALAADSFAIAHRTAGDSTLWWHANPDAPPAGVQHALRRALGILDEKLHHAGLVDDVQRDERGRAVHADEIVWSSEIDSRWDEYLEVLRRTGECLDAIEFCIRERREQEALGLWRSS